MKTLATGVVFTLFACLCGVLAGEEILDGFTEPSRKVELAPAEPGILRSIVGVDGATVLPGQILATLDDELLQISLKIATQVLASNGKYDAAKADQKLRQERVLRLQSLKQQGFAHREEVERAEADLAVADANLLALEEQKVLDRLEREKTLAMIERRQVRSPITGMITKVHHEAGEYIAGASPVLFTIVQLDPLRVVFAVPAATARQLQKDQPITARFPETGAEARGHVELVSPITDAESGLVRVKVLIANPQAKYPCGARCLLLTGGAGVGLPVARRN